MWFPPCPLFPTRATARKPHKEQDLLISFRVYDPDGDQEEPLPERHDASAGVAGQRGAAATADAAGASLFASTVASRDEAEAMAAAAAPGGLAARPPRAPGIAPLEPPRAAAGGGEGGARGGGGGGGGEAGEGGGGLAGFPGRPHMEGGVRDAADAAVGVGPGVDAIAAPAAGGWGSTAGRESGGVGGGNGGGGGGGGGGVGRGRRYFGLLSRDEWISASSSRIEKLNSRAPWKNSWTEEVPVNDKDDPYLTEDGAHLVFAVPRAPVDGSPCLVSNVIC